MESYNNDLNPGTAMLIEIVGTVFCFLGLGWIYSGQAGKGILLLLGYWVILAVELFFFFLLSMILIGILGFLLIPAQNVLFGIISGIILKQDMEKNLLQADQ